MVPAHLNIRAVIFDIYGTLLELGPPPPAAQDRWESLWEGLLHAPPRLSLEQFNAKSRRVIAREHAAARARGIAFPEVYWPAVVAEVLPELLRLSEPARSEFIFSHAQIERSVRLMPGAATALHRFRLGPLKLGLASNCQPYTLRELDAALDTAGLSRTLFAPELCFFSFEHGFSKPDPHVFQLLSARLLASGIQPAQTLMVGDRPDNDITPASAQGWQTWRLPVEPCAEPETSWLQLLALLRCL